jgi:hypothetical protein
MKQDLKSIKYVNKNIFIDCYLLACYAVLSGRSVVAFQNLLPLLSSEMSGHVCQTTWQHIPEVPDVKSLDPIKMFLVRYDMIYYDNTVSSTNQLMKTEHWWNDPGMGKLKYLVGGEEA